MARKRQTAVAVGAIPMPNGTEVVETVAVIDQPVIEVRPEPELQPEPPANGNGQKKKPVVSWRLASDRSTSIEVACWSSVYRNQATGEEFERIDTTVTRSYRDQNDVWCKGGSWRTHELPVLMFLLQKAHAFALNRRTSDSSIPF